MQKTNFKRYLILLIAMTLFMPIQKTSAIEDGIIAVVNNELISLKDLKDYIQKTYVSLVAQGVPDEDIKRLMLDLEINGINKLIEDKLILSHANKVGIEVREKIVNERINEIIKGYPSEDIFMESLIANGASLTDLRDKIKEQLKIKYIIDYEVRSKIFVQPQEVTQYYQKNKEKFQKKESLNLNSIFIAFKNNQWMAEKKAEEAYEKIENGMDFNEAAKEYSDAPPIGVVEKGQFVSNIENVIFSLNVGDVSKPTTVQNGVYIFRIEEKMKASTASLDDVRENINSSLFQQKFRSEFEKWLKELKKNAYIEIKQ